MALSLTKGGNISLSKTDPSLKNAIIGLGWDARSTDGADFDLDASAILVGANGIVRSDADFIFYNQLKSICGSVTHQGDNITGSGDGDDEQILINLERVPVDITKIVIVVTIHDADARRQNFGQVSNAYVRVINADSNIEATRYDLSEEASIETAMIFGEVYRYNGEWKFKAVGQGFAGGLGSLARSFGINV